MSRIKEYFLEHRNHQPLEYDEDPGWQESYQEYWLATHFETKLRKDGQWQEITLDLREYDVVIPHKSPALSYVINCKSKFLIQSPFNQTQYLWKKVQSNPSSL